MPHPSIGGDPDHGSSSPGYHAEDVRALLEYYRGELRDSAVKLELNKTVTPELVKRTNPDVFIVAIGAQSIRPKIPGADGENVITAIEALDARGKLRGTQVAVVGGGEVGCETALYLSQMGKDVCVIKGRDDILTITDVLNNSVVLKELLEKEHVKIYAGTRVEEITASTVKTISKDGNRKELCVDTVVLAVGLEPNKAHTKLLLDSCTNSFAVGDCVKPARILEAVREGDQVGRLV